MPQRQEPADRHRNSGIDFEALRYVTDARRRWFENCAAVGALDAQNQFDKGGLTGAIRPDQRDNLAGPDIEIDANEQVAPTPVQRQTAR